ncbi:hypothetical protein JTE90_025867 [Oedothorax gibbosus]|uniref:Uncharacterized protein n=1 Tax=Oedothorax gibbosus TaxID=931172 RepID=A0AAV6UNN6_9ARAC|nr:hypothetical protein JTE90_025867 [Oedothorax gibbosus]
MCPKMAWGVTQYSHPPVGCYSVLSSSAIDSFPPQMGAAILEFMNSQRPAGSSPLCHPGCPLTPCRMD